MNAMLPWYSVYAWSSLWASCSAMPVHITSRGFGDRGHFRTLDEIAVRGMPVPQHISCGAAGNGTIARFCGGASKADQRARATGRQLEGARELLLRLGD